VCFAIRPDGRKEVMENLAQELQQGLGTELERGPHAGMGIPSLNLLIVRLAVEI